MLGDLHAKIIYARLKCGRVQELEDDLIVVHAQLGADSDLGLC